MAEAFSWAVEEIKREREALAREEKGQPSEMLVADDRTSVAREAVAVARSWGLERRGMKLTELDVAMLVRRLNKLRKRG